MKKTILALLIALLFSSTSFTFAQDSTKTVVEPPSLCDPGFVDWTIVVGGEIGLSICAVPGKMHLDLVNRIIRFKLDPIFKNGFESIPLNNKNDNDFNKYVVE